tara:strand:+ start:1735 stop:2397 length:663 start_codon:yes stop_codon:yes gene_type:complete
MKEVVLTKDLPYLRIDVDGGMAQSIGPVPGDTGDFGTYEQAPGVNELFVHTSIIDIAGLTKQELTFFPIAGDCQRPATSMGVTQAFVVEWIIVAASPIDFSGTTINTLNMWNHLPGQLPSTRSFQNIMWGKAWTWTLNTNLLQNFAVAVNTTLLGSGEATNADKLYVYRCVRAISPTQVGFIELPAVRLLLSGQIREENDLSQIMRMKRVYDLQQEHDED